MTREHQRAALFILVLLLTGVLAWWLSLRSEHELDIRGLRELPATLNGWTAIDIEMDQDVARMLRADANVQRAYVHPLGYRIFVYIGYYGTERGGTPEHTPEICYPAQGWRIAEARRVGVGGEEDGFDVEEFIVEHAGETRLVHFWYRTPRATGITSIWKLRLHHFWGRLLTNRADGALVRLSTPFETGDLESARGKLRAMDLAVERALEKAWPQERSND